MMSLVLLLLTLAASAQPSRKEIVENVLRSGSNYFAYPGPLQQTLTPAPAGYEPFYISHYGRHGSRHLISDGDYDRAYKPLLKADSAGMLTPLGKDVLRRLTIIRNDARHRHGELTPLGAEQHRGIAHRMYERFPEVFKGKTNIDAKSTVVIRCILSMENALQELKALNPQLNIRHDASEHDMWYMNFDAKDIGKKRWSGETGNKLNEFKKNHANYSRLMRALFNDEEYLKEQVDQSSLNYYLWKQASNIQSTELRHEISLYDIYTEEEIYDNWLIENASWYVSYGSCKLNRGVMPFSQRNLLRMMIQEADSCLQYDHPGATLRYGHEVCVMPLACLLEMDNCGLQTDDLEQLDDLGWLNYRIFPMGCNVQLVFYKPRSQGVRESRRQGDKEAGSQGDILVKALLNENETTLPLTPVSGPYYRWSDFRDYFLKKLDSYQE